MYHGMYEVTFKALNYPPHNWDNVKEQKIVVEADDLSDARRVAEKKIKDMGYNFYSIGLQAIKFLKHTNKSKTRENDTNNIDYESTSSESVSRTVNKKAIGILSCIVLIMIVVVFIYVGNSMKVDGTYYLISITGTANISANEDENYLTLKDGVCTVHMSLTNPKGSSTHTYYYSGNKTSNIKFEDDFISMDYKDRVVITLQYDNGYYNIFTYEKK